jgi:hypothetical protein
MKCTVCNIDLDMRKKSQYVYSSYQLQSKGFMGNVFGSKDYWIFCTNSCKHKADSQWVSGNFEKLYGKKKINFKP